MLVKLSRTSKMPCKSWSLEARTTCPGSVDPKTKAVWPVCQSCYATKGFYHMPNTKKQREFNRDHWVVDGWIDEMVASIGTDEYFRWFDSGDIYTPRLAKKIYSVVRLTPNTKHWIPTKSWDIPKIRKWLDLLNGLSNCVVRFSNKEIDDTCFEMTHYWSAVTTHKNFSTPFPNIKGCPAYTQEGKCGDCRACWDKNVDLIVYPLH